MKHKPFATLLNHYLSKLQRPPSWLALRLQISLSTVEGWCAGLKSPANPETVKRIVDMLGVYEPAERQALLEAAKVAANDADPTPTTQKPASTTTHINTGDGFYSAGDTHVTGDVIANGQKNVFSGRFNAPIHTGRGHIYFERQQKSADPSLQELIETLRRDVKSQTSAETQPQALLHLDRLAKNIAARQVDLYLTEFMFGWYQRYLPSFMRDIANLISHPTVVEIVEATGDPARSEYQGLLEKWKQ